MVQIDAFMVHILTKLHRSTLFYKFSRILPNYWVSRNWDPPKSKISSTWQKWQSESWLKYTWLLSFFYLHWFTYPSLQVNSTVLKTKIPYNYWPRRVFDVVIYIFFWIIPCNINNGSDQPCISVVLSFLA